MSGLLGDAEEVFLELGDHVAQLVVLVAQLLLEFLVVVEGVVGVVGGRERLEALVFLEKAGVVVVGLVELGDVGLLEHPSFGLDEFVLLEAVQVLQRL